MEPPVDDTVRPSRRSGVSHDGGVSPHPSHAEPRERRLALGAEPGRVPRLQHQRAAPVPAEPVEERHGHLGIEGETGRQLDDEGPGPLAQRRGALHEALDQGVARDQPAHVRHHLGHLGRKAEPCRHAPAPALPGRDAMLAVERGVDLDRVEDRAEPFEVAALGREQRCRGLVDGPAGDADPRDRVRPRRGQPVRRSSPRTGR